MSRGLALALLVLVAGCRRQPAPAARTRDAGLRMSRGFGRAPSVPDKPSAGQLAKLAELERNAQGTVAVLPPEVAGRRVPTASDGGAVMDLYVDGERTATVDARAIREPLPLGELLRAHGVVDPRAVLVHGEANDLWIPGIDAAALALRVNNRGQIKIEPSSGGAGRRRGIQATSAPGPQPPHEPRVLEVRGVVWIEARRALSPVLAGEPAPGAHLENSRGQPLTSRGPGQGGGGGGRGRATGGGGSGGGQGSGRGDGSGKGDGSGGGHRRPGGGGP